MNQFWGVKMTVQVIKCNHMSVAVFLHLEMITYFVTDDDRSSVMRFSNHMSLTYLNLFMRLKLGVKEQQWLRCFHHKQ